MKRPSESLEFLICLFMFAAFVPFNDTDKKPEDRSWLKCFVRACYTFVALCLAVFIGLVAVVYGWPIIAPYSFLIGPAIGVACALFVLTLAWKLTP